MIGTTGLKGLRVDCIVGVYEHERLLPQTVNVDIELDYDFAAAARSDALADAVDYGAAATMVTSLAERRQFQLLETMAEEIAGVLLGHNPSVRTVRVEIRKPSAVRAADCSFVRLERVRI